MDTPGFDHESELEVFYEVVSGMKAVRPHARIIGILLIFPMHHTRIKKMDEMLLHFAREFCGNEYMTQVTVVTTFWEAHGENQKRKYNTRLANLLEKVKELWSVQGPISHYQHGRKYEDGQDTGVCLEWEKDQNSIVEYAKDMIHRNYGYINPRDPRIVQELEAGRPLERTAAGRSLGLTRVFTSNSASSSYSAAPGPEEEIVEKPKQDNTKQEQSREDLPNQGPPKQEPPSDGASKQRTGPQTIEKGWWDYGLDVLGTVVSNIHFEPSARSSGGFSSDGMGFSGGPPRPSLPNIPIEPGYNGPVGELAHVNILFGNLLILK